MHLKIMFAVAAVLASISLSPINSSLAQTVNGCEQSEVQNPPRVLYTCGNGLVLEAEAAAVLGIVNPAANGGAASADLENNAVMVEVEPGGSGFQILTPHAIAAVRGTVYFVDVTDTGTSVFVLRGEVAVSRPDGTETVLLGPGTGVDAVPGQPLDVISWQQGRIDNLLARFGR